MDKSILRKFAAESRKLLMTSVENQLKKYHIDDEFNKVPSGDLVILKNDKYTLPPMAKEVSALRDKLVSRIKQISKEQVIEEAAYTWFNRIIAIRYMEIHDMLPLTKDNQSLNIRVLSSKDGLHPEILKMNNLTNSALDLNIDIKEYSKISTENEQFNYILKKVCNKLGKVIPQIFGGYTDYIDVLLPDNLLLNSGFVYKLINEVPEDCFETVEVIGWLYQYYNDEEKTKAMSQNRAYKKNEIPYVTQLFTPDWIVKYMVENSLGRYWVERNYSDLESLSKNWKYFIKDKIEKKNERVKPTDITFIDPCSGSGHILVYAFEIFMQIYKSAGYNTKDIPELILKNNLFGLDIDDRAGQLSILSVLLKAREYDSNIFNKNIIKNLNVLSLQESNGIDTSYFDQDMITNANIDYLVNTFVDAKELGSLLKVEKRDYTYALEKLSGNILDLNLLEQIKPLIKQADILANKYDVVVTNPPYLSRMSGKLKEYVDHYYKEYSSDLFSVFMRKNFDLSKEAGYLGFMTPFVWMFIKSYQQLREFIIEQKSIISLVQMEYSAYEEATVPICTFVLSNYSTKLGEYIRLSDFKGGMDIQKQMVIEAINNSECKYRYIADKSQFTAIPGSPIAYWLNETAIRPYRSGNVIGNVATTKQGIKTGKNELFLRLWFETDISKTSLCGGKKWFPCNKGGDYRRWYGNNNYLLDWEDDGYRIKNYKDENGKLLSRPQNIEYFFREGITWTYISSSKISLRYSDKKMVFESAGSMCFPNKSEDIYTILAYLNSTVAQYYLYALEPTLRYSEGTILKVAYEMPDNQYKKIEELTTNCIRLCKNDWDSFETSWDFKKHPIVRGFKTIKESYASWDKESSENFYQLKANEEELNKIFINIYGLQDKLAPEVEEKDITIRKANLQREIKSFISYAVGCMFGRYSLDVDGLIFAGGKFDTVKYKKYKVDDDNIIPITDTEYFKDDIVARFKEFIEKTFGTETLYENINYIADVLGRKGNETSEQTIRRYFVNDFYKDHIQMYQKKPIYWLLDSGKKNGFKALIYLHRYDKDQISRVRLDYIGKVQTIYENRLKEIENDLNSVSNLSTYDVKQLEKEQNALYEKLEEVKKYYVKLSTIGDKKIEIDLDNGVTENYKLFRYTDPETNEETNILGEDKIIVPKKK